MESLLYNPINAYLLTISKSSKDSYVFRLREFCNFTFGSSNFDNCDFSTLHYVKILRFIEHKQKQGVSYNSINTTLSVIKSITYHAWQLQLITLEQYMQIKAIKKLKGSSELAGRMLTTNEVNNIKSFLLNDEHRLANRDLAMFTLAVNNGLRRVELARLKIADLDFTRNKIKVLGKGNNERTLPFTQETQRTVKRYLGKRKKGHVFLTIKKKPKELTPLNIHRGFERIIERTGCEPFRAHDLRRTFASSLLDNGADVFAVQLLLGHARTETTKKYDRRNEKVKDSTIKLLPY